MKIALVGPAHPFKGGIAQHTTRLATALQATGVTTALISWRRQYPERLYPGQLTVPDGRPEVPLFEPTTRDLSWNRPDSWVRVARTLRDADVVVFVVVTPLQLVAYHVMLRVLGPRVRTLALVHNVLPHESSPVDTPFLPGDLVPQLLLAAESSAEGLAFAADATGDHPATALWPVGLAPALSAFLATGEAKVTRFTAAHGAARALFPDPRPFLNLNTPEDLAAAEAMVKGAA